MPLDVCPRCKLVIATALLGGSGLDVAFHIREKAHELELTLFPKPAPHGEPPPVLVSEAHAPEEDPDIYSKPGIYALTGTASSATPNDAKSLGILPPLGKSAATPLQGHMVIYSLSACDWVQVPNCGATSEEIW